jgi:transcription elongation factor Elf1
MKSMSKDHPTDFICPGCGSSYKVVGVQADPELPSRVIHCRVCKEPLAAAHGEYRLVSASEQAIATQNS